MEKNVLETLIAFVMAMIGAAIVPKTATTIRTEKKTLAQLSVSTRYRKTESYSHDNSGNAVNMTLAKEFNTKPKCKCKA